jgi:hypothetical protein
MAPALINHPVLPAKPAANCDAYLASLLTELREVIDTIPVVPGASVPVPHSKVMDLRGVVSELIGAVRTELKWRAL